MTFSFIIHFTTRVICAVLPALSDPPEVMDVSTYTIALEWTAWDPNTHEGDPPLVAYFIYINASVEDQRSERVDHLVPSTTLHDLQANTTYEFRVAAVREGEGGTGPPSPAVSGTTLPGNKKNKLYRRHPKIASSKSKDLQTPDHKFAIGMHLICAPCVVVIASFLLHKNYWGEMK